MFYLEQSPSLWPSSLPHALSQVHEEANRDLTGWTGTDCSMPMCVQGFFDPFCTDLPQAPGGEVNELWNYALSSVSGPHENPAVHKFLHVSRGKNAFIYSKHLLRSLAGSEEPHPDIHGYFDAE